MISLKRSTRSLYIIGKNASLQTVLSLRPLGDADVTVPFSGSTHVIANSSKIIL